MAANLINPVSRADFLAEMVKSGQVQDHRLIVLDVNAPRQQWPWRFAITIRPYQYGIVDDDGVVEYYDFPTDLRGE